jgi:hypothetical protein
MNNPNNHTMSGSTIIALARVIANEEIDCTHKPSLMAACERMDALYDMRLMLDQINAPAFRLTQVNLIIEECEHDWFEELEAEYTKAVVYETEKQYELQRMGN